MIFRFTKFFFLVCLLFDCVAWAEDTNFSVTVRANFDFNILGGTPLNPGPDTGYIPFSALGDFAFELDNSLNAPSQPTSVPILNASGVLQGIPPTLPQFLPHTLSPNVAFTGGDLTNVVRDMNGEVISADVTNLRMQWELIGQPGGALDGVRLFSGDLAFDGAVNAIPFALGDVLQGPDVGTPNDEAFEVFLDGFPDPVVLGRKRLLTVVPEPAELGIVAILVFGFVMRRRA